MDQLLEWIVRAIVLFTAMPVHECAHGLVADKLGDDTARLQGRLTLNPFVHLDLIGSLMLIAAGFGWAKPVQVNPRRFKHPRRDMAITALAGPVANILMALLVMIIYKLLMVFGILFARSGNNSLIIVIFLEYMILLNLYLAVFNLLPAPPLDGFKVLGFFIPDKYYWKVLQYERYIALVIFALIYFTDYISGPINIIARAIYKFLYFITMPLNWLM